MKAVNGLCLELGRFKKQADIRLKQLELENFGTRLWHKEPRLWLDPDEKTELPMGWLFLTVRMINALPALEKFKKEISEAGFEDLVLLGMGGSSLAPYVMQKTFKDAKGLRLHVLDSTDPETIKKTEAGIDLKKTLFIVSSKSGTTAEVTAFYNYFYYRLHMLKGEKAGENFITITDEGSPLVETARRKKFRQVFINFPGIGGRFSALSFFGMVPAILMGIDVKQLLERAQQMATACGPAVPVDQNPGIILGTAIAELAIRGRDKLTYDLPPEMSSFGLWLEQLLAESTGKNGKGILPLNGHPFTDIETYSRDRVFLQYGFMGRQDEIRAMLRENVISHNFPVINIRMEDVLDLGKEFFRWEIATATAGSILGINPFDQPNVEESKQFTNGLLKKAEEEGKFPEKEPCLTEGTLSFFTLFQSNSAVELLDTFFSTAHTHDYITLQAYLPEEAEVERLLSEIQISLQLTSNLAVHTQFGPRYLHSTGQYHKGGPATGIFIQFISSSNVDIQIPEKNYSFGMLKRAQAFGDREALLAKGRRVILVDVGEDMIKGLTAFEKLCTKLHIHVQEDLKKPHRKRIRKQSVFEMRPKKKQETLVATMVVKR
jgi:transaldolase / glucose-6-phosphate isomerase